MNRKGIFFRSNQTDGSMLFNGVNDKPNHYDAFQKCIGNFFLDKDWGDITLELKPSFNMMVSRLKKHENYRFIDLNYEISSISADILLKIFFSITVARDSAYQLFKQLLNYHKIRLRSLSSKRYYLKKRLKQIEIKYSNNFPLILQPRIESFNEQGFDAYNDLFTTFLDAGFQNQGTFYNNIAESFYFSWQLLVSLSVKAFYFRHQNISFNQDLDSSITDIYHNLLDKNQAIHYLWVIQLSKHTLKVLFKNFKFHLDENKNVPLLLYLDKLPKARIYPKRLLTSHCN